MKGVQRGPFDVLPQDLDEFSPEQAVYLLRDLLLTEAMRIGIPITGVNAPFKVDAPDGGIDAELVIPAAAPLPAGLIGDGKSRYQVKTGAFKAGTKTEIKQLLLSPGNRGKSDPKLVRARRQRPIRGALQFERKQATQVLISTNAA